MTGFMNAHGRNIAVKTVESMGSEDLEVIVVVDGRVVTRLTAPSEQLKTVGYDHLVEEIYEKL